MKANCGARLFQTSCLVEQSWGKSVRHADHPGPKLGLSMLPGSCCAAGVSSSVKQCLSFALAFSLRLELIRVWLVALKADTISYTIILNMLDLFSFA